MNYHVKMVNELLSTYYKLFNSLFLDFQLKDKALRRFLIYDYFD